MNRWSSALLCSFFIALTAGCAQMAVERNDSPTAAASTGTDSTILRHGFLWGVIHIPPVYAYSVETLCAQSDLISLTDRMTTLDVLFTGLTLGIYVPHHLEIRCH